VVPQALLAELEGEVSPHHGSGWEEALEKHIRTKVHMMMPVETVRECPIETIELVELGCDDILKGTDETRMKHDLGEAVPP